MIKTIFAYTMELDDPGAALAEILEQIKPEESLLTNSLGIIICHVEFTEPEIIRKICKALPFPVIGMASMSAAVADHGEQMMFSIAVLTSDDVFFHAGLSDPLNNGLEDKLETLYGKTMAALPAVLPGTKPVMMLTLSPPLLHIPGDEIVDEMDRVSGGIPVFGSISLNYADRFRASEIIYQGNSYTDRLVITLLSGNLKPSFTIHSIPPERIVKQNAIITKSVKNRVIEINGAPALAYMESLGFSDSQNLAALFAIPFVVKFADGSSVVRIILEVSPEGHLVFGGAIPEGCTMSAGPIGPEDVINTSIAAVEAAGENCRGALMFSCFTRCLALGLDNMAEVEHIRERFRHRNIPFMFAYSGGEICPIPDSSGKLVNRFHNVSVICCGLE